MTVRSNIEDINQGTDYVTTINFTDANNQPIDLTDYTIVAKFKKSPSSTKEYSFDILVSPLIGEATLTLAANASANIPSGRYVYDCVITDPDNVKLKILEGILTINPTVSK